MVFIEGGGTIPWLGLIHQGLSDISQPGWGGWSGRFSKEKVKNVPSRHESIRIDEVTYGDYYLYTEDSDEWIDPETNEYYNSIYAPVWRWRQDYFNDFQARMDWCIATFDKANHNPIAVVNDEKAEKILYKSVKAGEFIILDATASFDPDGDELTHNWWIYNEAGTYKGNEAIIENPSSTKLRMAIPNNASGKTIHVILTLRDENNIVSLSDYRRIVISVE